MAPDNYRPVSRATHPELTRHRERARGLALRALANGMEPGTVWTCLAALQRWIAKGWAPEGCPAWVVLQNETEGR
jgi:hypothetical protein